MKIAQIKQKILANPLIFLLIFIPFAIAGSACGWNAGVVFALSALSVIPLAGYIGAATEALSYYTGPKIGGLLNATLGNAAELIITIVAIREGLLELVKASITGSVIGNLLLVMGFAMLTGGLKNGVQRFNRSHTGNHSMLLVIAIIALVIPSLFSSSIGSNGSPHVEALSLSVAGVMIIIYILGLIYSLHASSPVTFTLDEKQPAPAWSKITAIVVLAAATSGVVWISEILVGTVDEVVSTLGFSEFFLGIILIPVVGNVAEHLVAVQVALRNKMDLSVEIALSSSLQVALFVAPLLVFISLVMGNPLTLIFNVFELLALSAAVMISALVSSDGESNWLEGAGLLGVYLILGIAFFLFPA
jgi:Ca2+:H+ antiporter